MSHFLLSLRVKYRKLITTKLKSKISKTYFLKHLMNINILSCKICKNEKVKLKSKTLDWDPGDLTSALLFLASSQRLHISHSIVSGPKYLYLVNDDC